MSCRACWTRYFSAPFSSSHSKCWCSACSGSRAASTTACAVSTPSLASRISRSSAWMSGPGAGISACRHERRPDHLDLAVLHLVGAELAVALRPPLADPHAHAAGLDQADQGLAVEQVDGVPDLQQGRPLVEAAPVAQVGGVVDPGQPHIVLAHLGLAVDDDHLGGLAVHLDALEEHELAQLGHLDLLAVEAPGADGRHLE